MRLEIIRYPLNCASKDDGGWGIHTQGISNVFDTALNYVVLRILGLSADHPALIQARWKLHQLGKMDGKGALLVSSKINILVLFYFYRRRSCPSCLG